MQEKKEVETTI